MNEQQDESYYGNSNNDDLAYFNDGNTSESYSQQKSTNYETHSNNTDSDLAYFNGNESSNYPQITSNEQSLLKSILFAICFGLGGSVIFGILYYIKIIAFIGAYSITYFACLGYKKYNNNIIDKKGYLIVSTIAVIELLLTIIFTNAITLTLANPDYGFFQSVSLVADNLILFMSDIFIGFLFLFAGLYSYSPIRKRRRSRHTY